jgi:hypothetical protein
MFDSVPLVENDREGPNRWEKNHDRRTGPSGRYSVRAIVGAAPLWNGRAWPPDNRSRKKSEREESIKKLFRPVNRGLAIVFRAGNPRRGVGNVVHRSGMTPAGAARGGWW